MKDTTQQFTLPEYWVFVSKSMDNFNLKDN